MLEMETAITWIVLGISCVYDLMRKSIPLVLLIGGGVIGIILAWFGGVQLLDIVYALLPGGGLLLVSFLTREKIGYGDGMLLVVLGLLEGGKICLWDLGIGLFLLVLFVTILLFVRKADKNTLIPFAPFLLVAHVIQFGVRL